MMSSGGGGSVGFCGTTKNLIDSSASYTADYSGVGRRGQTLARGHSNTPDATEPGFKTILPRWFRQSIEMFHWRQHQSLKEHSVNKLWNEPQTRFERSEEGSFPYRVCLIEEKCTGPNYGKVQEFCQTNGFTISRHGHSVVWKRSGTRSFASPKRARVVSIR